MSQYERVTTTDDGEPLVDAFVAALQSVTAAAAVCTTGLHDNARADRNRDAAMRAAMNTREALEMRIYDLCNALVEARTDRDKLQDNNDELRDQLSAALARNNVTDAVRFGKQL